MEKADDNERMELGFAKDILDEKRMAVYNKLDGGFTDRELYGI